MDHEDHSHIDETSSLLDGSTESNSNENISFCTRFFCCRNVLVFLQFCGFITVYGMRANLSVALVAMVNQTFAEQSGNKVLQPECRIYHGNSSDDDTAEDGPFNWDQQTQGQSYYLPLQGITYPAATTLWSRWATPLERSTYIVFSFSGGDFGAIFSLGVSGWLSSLEFDGGWPLAFYVFGGLGILWFIVWMILIYESPSQHPRIAPWEKQHILKGIGRSQDIVTMRKPMPTPWKSILTSAPVWAIAALGFSYGWGWYVFLACLPSFFKEVLDFNIKKNGVLTALPFIASWTIKNLSARFSDLLQKRFGCTIVRKAFSTTALIIGAGLLLPVGFLKCSQDVLSIVFLTISCGALGLYAPTGATNPVDLSPRFSSIVMSISNVGTNIPGILSPVVAGYLTNHQGMRAQWKKVFYITCVIYFSGLLFFLIFGSGKEQAWNSPPGVKADDDDIASIVARRELHSEPRDDSDFEKSFGHSVQSSHSAVI
ncbi:vesicular glutamate transporter 3-like [Actinia tenebrosa]|uniref:Vesicular glutamate transporter 3-like n=1 Tax=Actinia tenebrosa TaxID=6105 RepID=A0A6P8HLF0_ACTTE|nr:vesicular glutamate transporter 3-like [Actinia tenebrosa]